MTRPPRAARASATTTRQETVAALTIKSDRWIRQMSDERQLIDPFSPALVREIDGRRIISAGASSYGYDMRLAGDGFRVFSSVYGDEIDPKRFDEASSLIEPPVRS